MRLEPLIRPVAGDIRLRVAPIRPDWIESGSPEARCAVLATSDDRAVTTLLWTCTAGRFTWRYDFDESLYILDGGVTISAPGLPERRLGPGDSIHFSRGAVATWVIDSHVRKLAFCRDVPPRPVSLALRVARGLRRRFASARRGRLSAPTPAET
jgi:uncharacterized cupin superfamily protein